MTREEMIAAVEGELERLDQIRALLVRSHSERFTVPEAAQSTLAGSQHRTLSPESRRRTVQTVKRRWTKQKRTPPTPDVN